MSNPTYWVSRHLQDQRRQVAQASSANKFNDKWNRLNSIYDNLNNNFLSHLDVREVIGKDSTLLVSRLSEATEIRNFIQNNINSCKITELSKYATSLKKLSMVTFALCKKLGVFNDIESFEYNSQTKSVQLNGIAVYFLG